MHPAITLRQIHYFIAVAEELHFGRAAVRLSYPQPALSKEIGLLEETLGVKLLIRSRHGSRLTESGKALLEYGKRIEVDLENGIREARRAGSGEPRQLWVGWSPAVGPTILAGVQELFAQQSPGVTHRLISSFSQQQVDSILRFQYQLGLVVLPIQDEELKAECLSREPFIVALPSKHRLAARNEVSLRELRSDPVIWIPPALHPTFNTYFHHRCRQAGYEPNIVQEVTSIGEMLDFVAAGVGLTFLNSSAQRLRESGVEYRRLADRGMLFETGMIYRRDSRSETVRKLVDGLRDRFHCGEP
ncbi:MAG TPA: LysR family transcriptional regulator [Bryobacteraceae bacterium]|nr:LysR family transcriptional regulator [Bryobacteraceae bacterium]